MSVWGGVNKLVHLYDEILQSLKIIVKKYSLVTRIKTSYNAKGESKIH